MRQPKRQAGGERDDEEAQEKQAEIAQHRPHRRLDRNAPDQACAIKPKAERRREQPDSHGDHENHAEVQSADSDLGCDRDQERTEDDERRASDQAAAIA